MKKCAEIPSRCCDALEVRLAPEPNAHTKGFVRIVALDHKNHTSETVGIAYKKFGNDMGLMLKHCPFCGERIDHGFGSTPTEKKQWLRRKMGDMPFSVRTWTALSRRFTADDPISKLTKLSTVDLRKIKGIGDQSIDDIFAWLTKFGLALKEK